MLPANITPAAYLRRVADAFQNEITQYRAPRLEKTRKQIQDAQRQRNMADDLEQLQTVLRGLAAAYDRNEVPEILTGLILKQDIRRLIQVMPDSAEDQAKRAALLALCGAES